MVVEIGGRGGMEEICVVVDSSKVERTLRSIVHVDHPTSEELLLIMSMVLCCER